MEVREYFKVAANQLRLASEEKKRELAQLRTQLDDNKRNAQQKEEEVKARIHAKESDMAKAQDQQDEPEKDRATKLREVVQLQNIVSATHDEAVRGNDEILKKIQKIEGEVLELENQARDLESKT
jgi:chromosome segregation ATPase